MKTDNTKRAIIIGIFIFIAIALLVAAVFTFGVQRNTFSKKIELRAVFPDVNGLQPGNNVWLYGVKIGVVKAINFYGASQVEVVMSLETKAQSHIHKDAKAKIGADGFIGNKIIIIYGGESPDSAADNSYLATETAISTDDIIATLQENNTNLLSITGDLKKITGSIRDGNGNIGKLIKDSSIVNNLNATVLNFKKVSLATEKTINQLDTYVSGLNKEGTLANKLVTDTVVFDNLSKTVFQLREAAGNIHGFAQNMQTASDAFNKTDNPVGLLLHDNQTAQNLKSVASNLSSASQKLDDDLEAVQHNFLLRGFFRKREKQKEQEAKDSANKKTMQ